MAASKMPPMTAFLPAARGPARAASSPPVAAPDAMLFQGSSFLRMAAKLQSKVAKRAPHVAKEPPVTGARLHGVHRECHPVVPRGVAEAFTECQMPPRRPHGEGSADVVKDASGAGLASLEFSHGRRATIVAACLAEIELKSRTGAVSLLLARVTRPPVSVPTTLPHLSRKAMRRQRPADAETTEVECRGVSVTVMGLLWI